MKRMIENSKGQLANHKVHDITLIGSLVTSHLVIVWRLPWLQCWKGVGDTIAVCVGPMGTLYKLTTLSCFIVQVHDHLMTFITGKW